MTAGFVRGASGTLHTEGADALLGFKGAWPRVQPALTGIPEHRWSAAAEIAWPADSPVALAGVAAVEGRRRSCVPAFDRRFILLTPRWRSS